jgi:hypothetical protein
MAVYLAPLLAQSVPGVGILGGIAGGSAALAKGLKARKNGENISNSDMAKDTAKEAAGAGAATALGIYAAGIVGGGLVLSLGTAFAAAVVGKYTWDRLTERLENVDKGALFSGKD